MKTGAVGAANTGTQTPPLEGNNTPKVGSTRTRGDERPEGRRRVQARFLEGRARCGAQLMIHTKAVGTRWQVCQRPTAP